MIDSRQHSTIHRWRRGAAWGILSFLILGMLVQQPTAAQYIVLAQRAQARLEYGRALAWYRDAATLDPTLSAPWLGIAQIRLWQSNLADATSAIQHAERLAPRDAAIWQIVGNIALAENQLPAAQAAWQRAVVLDPQSGAGQAAALALMRWALNAGEPALALAASAAILHPNAAILLARASAYLHTDDAALALAIFAQIPPDVAQASPYQPLAATWRNTPTDLAALGYADLGQGMPALALAPLEAALTRDPTYGAGHAYLGWAWLQLGKLAQAQTELRAAQRFAPELPLTAGLQALLLAQRGQAAPALAVIRRWQAQRVPSATLWTIAATIAAQQGDLATEEAAYWNAATVATGADRPPALLNLTRFYLRTGLGRDNGRAAWAVGALWSAAPRDPQVIDLAGQWAERTGNIPAALADYLQAIQAQPEQAAFHAHAGLLEYHLGDVVAARLQLASALDLATDNDTRQEVQPILALLGAGANG